MPIDPPAGYLTRPEAAKQFNRSQRALERDLNVALALKDPELLSPWKLVTKDGAVREAPDVSLELVNQLVTDGMTPAWCVSTAHLREKYGQKGEPRPQPAYSRELESSPPSSSTDSTARSTGTSPSDARPDDPVFLRELVRSLEREKQQERERHDRVVAKLFDELDVKNKQISAWDGVTQGLMKALATGQIAPSYQLPGERSRDTQTSPSPESRPESMQDPPDAIVEVPVEEYPPVTKAQPHTRSKTRTSRATGARPQKAATKQKPKWHELPTFKRLFSRK